MVSYPEHGNKLSGYLNTICLLTVNTFYWIYMNNKLSSCIKGLLIFWLHESVVFSMELDSSFVGWLAD
jgi:hypothetical protein